MTPTNPTVNLPPAWVEPDARGRIRRALAEAGRWIAVLDDDPTGSQTVHGVDVVTVFAPDEIAAGLSEAGSTCFFLTNTRSLSEADAVELNTRIGRMLFELADRLEVPIDVVSRSDSTLRGHVIAEVRGLDAVRRQAAGRGVDGVLLVSAYFEAGRFTVGDVHWARVGADVLPVSETEFARDATFGYAASDLRDFVAEKRGGTIGPGEVLRITLDDIRLGGPGRVAEVLAGVTGGRFVVVNLSTPTWRWWSSGCWRRRRPAGPFCAAAGRRSCRPWPGWTRGTRCRPRTSGRPVVPAGTGSLSSGRTSA